jgi:hypothetical protein
MIKIDTDNIKLNGLLETFIILHENSYHKNVYEKKIVHEFSLLSTDAFSLHLDFPGA